MSRPPVLLAVSALCVTMLALTTAKSYAQASPAPSPAPKRVTVVSEQYDGKTHMSLTPYVWLPTVNGTFTYPVRSNVGGVPSTGTLNAQVGPNSYLTHLNFAAMGAFDIQKGGVGAFTDFITLNLSSGATFVTAIGGPDGHLHIPINLNTTGSISSSIWEAAGTLSLAHSDAADVNLLVGWRQVSLNGTLNYNVSVGGLIGPGFARSGHLFKSDEIGDVIFGLKGKVAVGDKGWFVPYYADYGVGAPNNDSWQAYVGVGKATKNGAILLAFRELNYDFGTQSSFVQKARFGGPLLGYTFKL